MGTKEMKKNGWLRLTLLLSFTWVAGISSLAIYETFNWNPAEGDQYYYRYIVIPHFEEAPAPAPGPWNKYRSTEPEFPKPEYSKPDTNQRDTGDKRFFLIKAFAKDIFRPLIVLWVLYGFLYYGGRWVWAGFKQGK